MCVGWCGADREGRAFSSGVKVDGKESETGSWVGRRTSFMNIFMSRSMFAGWRARLRREGCGRGERGHTLGVCVTCWCCVERGTRGEWCVAEGRVDCGSQERHVPLTHTHTHTTHTHTPSPALLSCCRPRLVCLPSAPLPTPVLPPNTTHGSTHTDARLRRGTRSSGQR